MIRIECIVEGHGEVGAARILVQRIAQRLNLYVEVPRPIRLSQGRLRGLSEDFSRRLRLVAARSGSKPLGLLVLADAEQGCPAQLGPPIREHLAESGCIFPFAVVLANPMFESWFLAAAESLRGVRGLPPDLTRPVDPESVPGAKRWLTGRMAGASKYEPPRDQPAFTRQFDLDEAAANSRSLARCLRVVEELIREVQALTGGGA